MAKQLALKDLVLQLQMEMPGQDVLDITWEPSGVTYVYFPHHKMIKGSMRRAFLSNPYKVLEALKELSIPTPRKVTDVYAEYTRAVERLFSLGLFLPPIVQRNLPQSYEAPGEVGFTETLENLWHVEGVRKFGNYYGYLVSETGHYMRAHSWESKEGARHGMIPEDVVDVFRLELEILERQRTDLVPEFLLKLDRMKESPEFVTVIANVMRLLSILQDLEKYSKDVERLLKHLVLA